MHLVLGGVSPGFVVASIWISRGSCPGSRATSMKAFISSPSLPSCSSTWAASPMPSRSGACLATLRTTTRLSPRNGVTLAWGQQAGMGRDRTGWDGFYPPCARPSFSAGDGNSLPSGTDSPETAAKWENPSQWQQQEQGDMVPTMLYGSKQRSCIPISIQGVRGDVTW